MFGSMSGQFLWPSSLLTFQKNLINLWHVSLYKNYLVWIDFQQVPVIFFLLCFGKSTLQNVRRPAMRLNRLRKLLKMVFFFFIFERPLYFILNLFSFHVWDYWESFVEQFASSKKLWLHKHEHSYVNWSGNNSKQDILSTRHSWCPLWLNEQLIL